MTAELKWYPVAAAGTLVITGVAVFITTTVQRMLEEYDTSRETGPISERPAPILDLEMSSPVSHQGFHNLTMHRPFGNTESSKHEPRKRNPPTLYEKDPISSAPVFSDPPPLIEPTHATFESDTHGTSGSWERYRPSERPGRRRSSPPLKGYSGSRITHDMVGMYADPRSFSRYQVDLERGRENQIPTRHSARRKSPAGFLARRSVPSAPSAIDMDRELSVTANKTPPKKSGSVGT
jgi:hypothetical protein